MQEATDRPLVYLAGPYSRPDPIENTRGMIELATELYDGGLVVPVVPHLTMLWHLVMPKPIEYWYEYDLQLLRRCDAVLRIPGESHGADKEVAEANRLGIPVFDDRESLEAWATTRRA